MRQRYFVYVQNAIVDCSIGLEIAYKADNRIDNCAVTGK